MFIGKVMMILSLSVSIALNIYPLRIFTYELFGMNKNSNTNNFILSLIYTIVPVVIASCFKGVTSYMGLAGAIAVTLIVFTIPGLCALKLGYGEKKWIQVLIATSIGVVTGIGCIGCYLDIQEFLHK